jgi:hypothetical protein
VTKPTNRDQALEYHSRKLKESVDQYAHLIAYSCHQHFIGGSLEHGSKEYDEFHKAFNDLWDQLVAEGCRSPDERETVSFRLFYGGGRDLPSTFRDHLDFFVDLIAMVVRRIFRLLLDIAGEDGVPWAREEALRLVREIDWRKVVAVLIREACGGEGGDAEAWLFPAWLRMKPAGPDHYNAERGWRGLDAAGTQDVLNYFVVEIVGKLEGCIEEASGDEYQRVATLEAAQRREPKVPETIQSANPVEEPGATRLAREDQGADAKKEQELTEADIQSILHETRPGTLIPRKTTGQLFRVDRKTIYNWGITGELEIVGDEGERGGVTLTSIRRKWASLLPAERERLLRRKG